MTEFQSDAERTLIEQAQAGDRHAYEELVQRHYPGVINIVVRMCGDVHLAEDATQEAFLRAWMNLASFQHGSPLRNWLCRIAINATIDTLRRKREEPADDEEIINIMDTTPGPEAVLIEKEQIAMLQKAMRSLPDAARSVLVLREYGELSYEEIASALEIPLGTVMSRLNNARTRLKEILKEQVVLLEHEYA